MVAGSLFIVTCSSIRDSCSIMQSLLWTTLLSQSTEGELKSSLNTHYIMTSVLKVSCSILV